MLLFETILLALPKDHALLQKETIVLGDLIQEEFICLNEYWKLGKEIKEAMERICFIPKATMVVDNPNMMRAAESKIGNCVCSFCFLGCFRGG